MKKNTKKIIALSASALLLCGCFNKKEAEEAEATASPSATPSATAATAQSAYSASNFTLTVTDTSENGLKSPLNAISIKDPNGNDVPLTLSSTNQRTTYECDDYSLSVSYSLLTDGVNSTTTVKYLLEVTDKTTSTAAQSSAIQQEVFNYLPDTDWYEDGSAMVNKTETDTSDLTKDSDSDTAIDIDIDESELGTSTSDTTVCVCDACGKEFSTTTEWYAHVMEAHGGSASYHIETK